jgi:hypothetical protein
MNHRPENNIDSLIAALAGFILVLLFTRHGGTGISPDSIAYTSAARNFIDGNGFTDYTGQPLVLFPLFYPFFLSVMMFVTQYDIISIAPFLNALLFATVIFVSGTIMNRFKYSTIWYKRIVLAIITVSPSLIEIYTMLWSETLFILLTLIFILYFQQYLQTHKTVSLIKAAIVAAIAFDTRYAGITLVATGCLLLLFDKNLNWKRKFTSASVFTLTGISLLSINLIRNATEQGLITGTRQKGVTPLINNIGYSGNVLSDWIAFRTDTHLFFEILAIGVMILFVVFFIRNIRHWKAYYTYENIAVAFFIVYVSFIVVSSTISRYEKINNRLLGPAFIAFVWISSCQLPKWQSYLPHRRLKQIFILFSMGVAFLLIGSYVAINTNNLSWMKETGIPGYSEESWTNSHIVHYLQKHHEIFETDTIEIYSNHNQVVYFLTGYNTETVPERAYKKDVAEFTASNPCYLIWFLNDSNPNLLTLKDIRQLKHMKLLHGFRDGAIFLLEKKTGY